jgi:hypothetical protein
MIQTKLYYNNIWIKGYDKKNAPKNGVEQTESNERSFPYLYPIANLVQGSLHRGIDVCID